MTETAANDTPLDTLLLVDSEVLIRLAIADYLRSCGYRVAEAATTDEAMVVMEDGELEVDVVLCDVAVTGSKTGFEFSHWLREHHMDVDMVLVGNAAAAADAAADLCDRGPLLSKPYDQQLVLVRVQSLIAERNRKRKKATAQPVLMGAGARH